MKKNNVENVFRRKWNDKMLNYLANDPFPNKIHRRRELWGHQQINLYMRFFRNVILFLQQTARYYVICIELLLLLLLSLLFMNGISNKSLRLYVFVFVYLSKTIRCDKIYIVLSMRSCRLTLVKWLKSILFLLPGLAGSFRSDVSVILPLHRSTSHRRRAF